MGTGLYRRHRIRERASPLLLMQIRVALFAPLQPVSLPRFSLPSPFFFLTRFARPPPPCLVREFSWLAELTAFGKIASSTHCTGGYQRGLLSQGDTLRVFSVRQPFPSPSLVPPFLSISSPDSVHNIVEHMHTHADSHTVGFDRALSARSTRATKSLPLLEPVSRAHVTW